MDVDLHAAAIRPPETLLGYRVYDDSLQALVDDAVARCAPGGQRRASLACLNPHSYVMARSEPRFAAALRRATWLVPDGAGIVLASRILGGAVGRRMTGHDVFIGISEGLDARGPFSALFVGSTEATLAAVATRYRRDFGNASVHLHSPPFRAAFGDDDVAAIEAIVGRHRPDVLWLGLTAPKQELLLDRLQASTDFGVGASIGAVFDFYVGNVKRSPKLFQRLGLEWLPRLVQQPRRLWRRTFVSAPIFVVDLLRARIGLDRRSATKP